MKIVIIGNSAAGTAAIEAIRRHDRESEIIQLSDEAAPLYSRCLLSYYLAGTIKKETLLYRDSDFHQKMNVSLHAGPGFRAVELKPGKRRVTCDNGKTFDYDRLLISTGSSAKLPSNMPKDVEGIYVLRNLADCEALKEKIQDARSAVVSGGGLIGIKTAIALNTSGLKTTVIVRSDRVLSQMIDAPAGEIVLNQLRENNIDVLFNTEISEVIDRNKKPVAVKTDQGEIINCDVLIAAKGVNPNTGIIEGAGIEKKWGIKTDSFMRTNDENIYAAGDVAEAFDIVLEDHTVNALWTCAVQQGHIAGLNMVGKQTPYNGAVGMNSLNVCNISLISFGITTPDEESKYKIVVRDQTERNRYKKIVIGADNRIKGVILLGRIANAGALLALIQKKTDVSAFEDELLNDRFNFGKLLKYGVSE